MVFHCSPVFSRNNHRMTRSKTTYEPRVGTVIRDSQRIGQLRRVTGFFLPPGKSKADHFFSKWFRNGCFNYMMNKKSLHRINDSKKHPQKRDFQRPPFSFGTCTFQFFQNIAIRQTRYSLPGKLRCDEFERLFWGGIGLKSNQKLRKICQSLKSTIDLFSH